MYILAILAIIFSTVYVLLINVGLGGVRVFMDFPSLLLLFVLAIPILASAGLLKDFNNAFKIALGKKGNEITLIAVRRAIEAVALMRKILLYGGGFGFLMAFLIMLHYLNDPSAIGPTMAVSSLTALYGVVANLLLLPIASRLKIKMIEFMQE